MKIRLYQIVSEKDDKNLMFMSYEFTVLHYTAESTQTATNSSLTMIYLRRQRKMFFAFSTWNIRTDTEAAL